MLKAIKPAVDAAVRPRAGHSRGGQPLSYNRAPAEDLAPWVGGLYATHVELPENYCLDGGLLSDTSFVRIQLGGHWQAQTVDGPMERGRSLLVFGPNTRMMPVRVTGSFLSVGISLRPGAGYALRGADASHIVDRIVDGRDFRLDEEGTLDALRCDDDPENWLLYMENRMRQVVESARGALPDPVTVAFEEMAFADPAGSIADFAKKVGISQRQLARIVRRDFGMPPKQILRRARALDMASHLRGVADAAEAEALTLRYFDQAQMTREFTQFFGVSPRRFMAEPNPLMTLALESRQARRLAALERLAPNQPRPWQ